MTWKALNSSTRSSGAPFLDYDGFKYRWDQEQSLPAEEQVLHKLVDRFDGNGLVIKTNKSLGPVQPEGENPAAGKISQMARHAMK